MGTGIRIWRGFVVALLALGAVPALASTYNDVIALAHSHNDYERNRPLWEALDNDFTSVEADIWMHRDDIWVSHLGIPFTWKGTLRDMYLDPLQKLVRERGSVHGDGKPFYLWLDIKDGSQDLRDELRRQLMTYDMISFYDDVHFFRRPVVVILTGDEDSKRRFTEETQIRHAIRDSNDYSPSDPPADVAWRWYALKWGDYVSWSGKGEPSSRERQQLAELIGAVHAKGRLVRFWDVPENTTVWRTCVELGADEISTDRPADFRYFAMTYTPKSTDRLATAMAQ